MIQISQEELENFLTEHKGKWFTSKQLEKELNISAGSVSSNIRRAGIHRTVIRRRCLNHPSTLEYSINVHEEPMQKTHVNYDKLLKEEEE